MGVVESYAPWTNNTLSSAEVQAMGHLQESVKHVLKVLV